MMSYLAAVGGTARVVGPSMVTNMYVTVGPRWTFITIDVIIVLSIFVMIIAWKRLVPFHLHIIDKIKNRASYVSEEGWSSASAISEEQEAKFFIQDIITVL